MNSRRSAIAIWALGTLITATSQAQTPAPTDQDKLLQAIQAAADAAKSAKEAAEASRQAAESMAAIAKQVEAKPAEPAKPVEPPKPPEPPKPSPWTFQIAANLLSVTGNATAVTGKVAGRVEGRWTDWAVLVKADAAYGQAEPTTGGPASVTALNASGLVKGDRKLSEILSAYLSAGGATDHVASIEYQAFGEAGVSVVWYEHKEADFVRSRVRSDLGFRYTRESDFRYYPAVANLGGQNIFAARVAGSFLYSLTKTSLITEDLEVLPDVVNPKNVRATSTTALAVELVRGVAIQAAFKVRYIGVPAAGAKSTDTELGAGVSWTF
jgi:putative salt-induced outer membrane protein YdiY